MLSNNIISSQQRVQGRQVVVVNFFIFLKQTIFVCFVVAIFNLVQNVEAMLRELQFAVSQASLIFKKSFLLLVCVI